MCVVWEDKVKETVVTQSVGSFGCFFFNRLVVKSEESLL